MFTGTMCSVYGTAFGAILLILGAVTLAIGMLSNAPIFFILFVSGAFGLALGGNVSIAIMVNCLNS